MKRSLLVLFLTLTVCLTGCDGQEITIDLSKIVTDTNAPPVNLTDEIARAKSQNKLLLLEFGSSDSCPPCIIFEQKVHSTPEFQAYEKTNLNFVRLDYPMKVELRPDTKATNFFLAEQFQAFGYPTFIGLDYNGKEFWRQEGISRSQLNPKDFIALLESVKAKQK